MNKSFKTSLTIVSLAIIFTLLGITSVSAAEPIVFQTLNAVELKEVDLGTLVYDTKKWETFVIKNVTSDEITISNVAFDTDKFEIAMIPNSTLAPNETTFIQINNIRGIDVPQSPITGNLIVTVNGTTDVTLPIKVAFEKGEHVNPDYVKETAIGKKLSSITLTNGWVWVNPNTEVLAGRNNYEIAYTDTTGNYKDETRQIEIVGLITYDVILKRDSSSWSIPTNNYEVLKGYSSNLEINAVSGYFLTSITVNGIEQLTDKTRSLKYRIENISEDLIIEIKTERTIYELMKDSITNETIIPKYIKGTEGTIELKFDYDFSRFYANDVRINGEYLDYEYMLQHFKFSEGSVAVDISNEYLNTLDVGTYDFELDLLTGELFKGTFIVEEKTEVTEDEVINNPQTSDDIIVYTIMFAVSVIGITGTLIMRKNKINN